MDKHGELSIWAFSFHKISNSKISHQSWCGKKFALAIQANEQDKGKQDKKVNDQVSKFTKESLYKKKRFFAYI